MYKSTAEQKSRDAQSEVTNPIKKSDKYIEEIADMKRNNADPTQIKNKVNKLTSLDMNKWKKYQDRLTNAEKLQQQKLNEITKGPLPEKPQTAQASVKKPPLKGSFVESFKSIIEEPATKVGEEAKPDT